MTVSGTTSDNKWQRVTTSEQSGTTSDNEWQRMTTSCTTSDKGWQRVIQRVRTNVTTNGNKWDHEASVNSFMVRASDSSGTTNENGIVHFKEWMTAILSMTETNTLLLQGMGGWN